MCLETLILILWTQFKESLIISTQLVFTVKETGDFEFRAADFKTDVKGKLFSAMAGDKKQIEESRIKLEEGKLFLSIKYKIFCAQKKYSRS